MRLLIDCETDGFLETMTTIHSLVLIDVDTGQLFSCTDAEQAHRDVGGTIWDKEGKGPRKQFLSIAEGVRLLSEADQIIGHNIIRFDLPAIQKLYPSFNPGLDRVINPCGLDSLPVVDTLVLSRLIWPDMWESDQDLVRRGTLPSRLTGSHALEAWGYRLGVQKGEYAKDEKGKTMLGAFESWNPDMQRYCEQDVVVTEAFYSRRILDTLKQDAWKQCDMAVWLEHRFADILARQERHGFAFDEESAGRLYASLVKRRLSLKTELLAAFPPKVKVETFIPKANNRTKGYQKGQPIQRSTTVEFNPSSRPMIGERLMELGWKPVEYTPTGQPKIDEGILMELPYPEAKLLAEYFLVEKRIGQIAEGDQAWLRLAKRGRIHGSVNTNGAVTGRCTHSNPNVAQVPKVGSPYGAECRALFTASPGMILVGADLAGLELRCLAHFMAKYDDGQYGKVLLEGDIHWANVLAMALTTGERDDSRKDHKIYRNGAKTFIYGFLYGAGDEKAGRIVFDLILALRNAGLDTEAVRLQSSFFGEVESPAEDDFKKAGSKLKRSFLKKTPALKKLREAVKDAAEQRKYLKGIDGRVLKVRSPHAALNTLLQSAGALIAKLATVLAYDELSTRGYVFGSDWALVAHVHDELQSETREELANEVGTVIVESMWRAGQLFSFRIPIDGEFKLGRNWRDTH
jgi:DNA polymerase I-like protein with 3'-5' exonuclease and polymerase domains